MQWQQDKVHAEVFICFILFVWENFVQRMSWEVRRHSAMCKSCLDLVKSTQIKNIFFTFSSWAEFLFSFSLFRKKLRVKAKWAELARICVCFSKCCTFSLWIASFFSFCQSCKRSFWINSIPGRGLSVWSWHVLPVCAWVLSGFSPGSLRVLGPPPTVQEHAR